MKHCYSICCLLLVLSLFSSCMKEANKKPSCTGEIKYAALYFNEYEDIAQYTGAVINTEQRFAAYVEGNGSVYSRYYTELTVSNFCGLDPPMIEFEVWLKNEDNIAVKSAYIEEPGKPGRTELVLEQLSDVEFYRKNVQHTFQDASGNTTGSVLLHLEFSFPHQGNPSADSLYFFSNLEQIKTTVTGSEPGN